MAVTKMWLGNGKDGSTPLTVAGSAYDSKKEYRPGDSMDGRFYITPGDDLAKHIGADGCRMVDVWEDPVVLSRWNQQTPVKLYASEADIEPKRGRIALVMGATDWVGLIYQQIPKAPIEVRAGELIVLKFILRFKVGGGASVIPEVEVPFNVRV